MYFKLLLSRGTARTEPGYDFRVIIDHDGEEYEFFGKTMRSALFKAQNFMAEKWRQENGI